MFFHLNLIFHHRIYIFVKHWFQVPFSGIELKGNPVKIGNSPAAVSSANENGNHSYATDMTIGKAPLTGVSQKTCHT